MRQYSHDSLKVNLVPDVELALQNRLGDDRRDDEGVANLVRRYGWADAGTENLDLALVARLDRLRSVLIAAV